MAKWIDWHTFRHTYPIPSYASRKTVSEHSIRLWFHKDGYKTITDIPFLWHPQWFLEFYNLPTEHDTHETEGIIRNYILEHKIYPQNYMRYHHDRKTRTIEPIRETQQQDVPCSETPVEINNHQESSPISRRIDTVALLDKIQAHAPCTDRTALSPNTKLLTDEILDILQKIYDDDTEQ